MISAVDDPNFVPASEIKEQPEVRDALRKSAPAGAPERRPGRIARILFHLLAGVLFGLSAVLVSGGLLGRALAEISWLPRLLLAAAIAFAILALYEVVALLVLPRLRNPVARYNVERIFKLATMALLLVSLASVFFVGWYAAVVSFGLLSVILGIALQAPITSFFGWVFILVRAPYRVGDRIRIGEATGDVIDVGYLDTTLWEFGGQYLSTDHPSGRLIKFPNSLVFNSIVYNYSWPLFPYIWNEIAVQVAYESDLEFVARTMRDTVEEERGPSMTERIQVYRDLLAKTPVDELEVDERPSVLFRTSANTWVEAIVRYLVAPRRAGRVKTALTQKILARLNQAPDKVLFPKENLR
jgi:small-conductance mechanosensitive channel